MIGKRLSGALLVALLVGSGGYTALLHAQDNPFESDPVTGEASNPFAEPAAAPAQDPFAAPADPSTPADPFATANPLDMPSPSDSPFEPTFGAAPATGAPGTTPADTTSPFATEDPFATGAASDPFAMGGEPAAPPPAPTTPSDPFAAGTTPETTTAESINPFGPAPVDTRSMFTTPGAPGETAGTTRGIAQLYEFRYVKQRRPDGTDIVVRKRMTQEDVKAWDEKVLEFYTGLANEGKLANFVPGQNDAGEWAQWMLYANQLELWAEYCSTVALVGLKNDFDPKTDIPWPGTPPEPTTQGGVSGGQLGFEGGGATGGKEGGSAGTRQSKPPEFRTGDEELAEFNPIPDTRRQSAPPVIDPNEMNDKAATLYANFLSELRAYEAEQQKFMIKLKADLDDRERRREAYADWRETQKRQVIDFVQEWARRYDGRVITIAGVRYELYRPGEVPSTQYRGANIVETDYDLTPYDLLNADGTLRGPAR